MRDLRSDLRQRMHELDAQNSELVREYNAAAADLQKKFETRADALDKERRAAWELLKYELLRHGEVVEQSTPELPLAEFFIKRVRRMGAATKDQLRFLAGEAKYFADGDAGGRATHTTLLNLVRAKRLIESEDGSYRAPPTGSDTIMGQAFADSKRDQEESVLD